jgi:hypothetical protein
VPQPVDPREVPPPLVDPRALARATAADAARAESAEREGLSLDVRELGSAVRAHGLAEAESAERADGAEAAGADERDDRALLAARSRVVSAAARAIGLDEEGVLRLRAYELRSFLREVRRWEATGEETAELRELGGGFLRMLQRSGWRTERRVLLDAAALRAAWKKRWNDVAGVQRPAFEPALDELRAFYRFLLARPPLARRGATRLPEEAARARDDQYRLKKIDELSVIDAAYPGDLARGIVLYRLGRYLPSVEAFRRHLDASPDGPFTLRAQNYLRAALGRAAAEEL